MSNRKRLFWLVMFLLLVGCCAAAPQATTRDPDDVLFEFATDALLTRHVHADADAGSARHADAISDLLPT